MWKYYAILSALFAALTAIFAKIGVRDINSNLATAIRTTIILLLTWGIVIATGTISQIRGIGRHAGVSSSSRALQQDCHGCSISRHCRQAMSRVLLL